MTARYQVLRDDPGLEFVCAALTAAGYAPERRSDAITIRGAGVGQGDYSVDLDVSVIRIDDVRVVLLSCLLRSVPGTYSAACLAAARGNGNSIVAKFGVHEMEELPVAESARFRVRASLPLFADHLSVEEFTKMTWLFLKETDGIDNELAEILKG